MLGIEVMRGLGRNSKIKLVKLLVVTGGLSRKTNTFLFYDPVL